jgi:hypothetical protein
MSETSLSDWALQHIERLKKENEVLTKALVRIHFEDFEVSCLQSDPKKNCRKIATKALEQADKIREWK